jgi:hypothetical protein
MHLFHNGTQLQLSSIVPTPLCFLQRYHRDLHGESVYLLPHMYDYHLEVAITNQLLPLTLHASLPLNIANEFSMTTRGAGLQIDYI